MAIYDLTFKFWRLRISLLLHPVENADVNKKNSILLKFNVIL